MKWGHINDIENSQRLLYWVLMFILAPYFDDSIDHWLKDILKENGGLSGDPGWEMEHFSNQDGFDAYRVSADPDISGIEPAEAIYNADVVHQAIRKSLIAFGNEYPQRINEVKDVLRLYRL